MKNKKRQINNYVIWYSKKNYVEQIYKKETISIVMNVKKLSRKSYLLYLVDPEFESFIPWQV
jgi:hypothetical protein